MIDYTDNIISFLDFWETHAIPDFLRKPLADWCGENCGCYFKPDYCRDYTRSLRKQEFDRLFRSGNGFTRCRSVLKYGGISKKILIGLIVLARMPGGFAIAECMYLRIYSSVILPFLKFLRQGRK